MQIDSAFKQRRLTPTNVCVFAFGLVVGFAICSLTSLNFCMEESSKISLVPNNTVKTVTDKTLVEMQHDKELNSSLAKELLLRVEEMEARKLAEKVRVLCWVMTAPENHEEKAVHVKATWGRHCNKLIFISNKEGVKTGREGLWSKTVAAFKYVHENCSDEYDWVMKADDDTYVVVENLRKMLLPYPPKDPHYFGFRFKTHTPVGYMSGGGGYVLSKEAVRRVVTEGFDGKIKDCRLSTDTNAEDVNMGDSRDALGRNRFFPFDPQQHTHVDTSARGWWYWDYIWWPTEEEVDNCSDEVVSFHYLDKFKMYMMEYLVYHVKPFSVRHLKKYDNMEYIQSLQTDKKSSIKI
ncbi:glycoprotein-N-acetylgalactosamine 3-beta-galactosyltransferase 1-like isoform X2 [Neocloeon triangulifer]|uniref:glycoprotein-N-acetylgalactosamine 3-beta-galactosyltransferase 1-like isoform X2 n=1 Tax=Neocloeon triangulifer TaxID=2078957 RepID=UPI00286FA25C|nr:glycoprotein-N-acetylgalactosamine 3-beta-galactosyltransferase 1-like isoform X2 [Neocloeon triangulifer]